MKYDKPKGSRIKSYGFLWVALFDCDLWWNITRRKWEKYDSNSGCEYSLRFPCKSVRAFRRILRKHPHINKHAALISQYVHADVYSS